MVLSMWRGGSGATGLKGEGGLDMVTNGGAKTSQIDNGISERVFKISWKVGDGLFLYCDFHADRLNVAALTSGCKGCSASDPTVPLRLVLPLSGENKGDAPSHLFAKACSA